MTNRINYCANGCVRRHGDTWDPVTTESTSLLCRNCEERLRSWLRKIPDLWLELSLFIEHGAVEKNPDSKATKSAVAQAPMRLDIIDLLDVRRGRKWNGLTPAKDRRGVAGWLKIHLDALIEERPLTTTAPITTITAACNLLGRHMLWLTEQPWIVDLYDDMKRLHRTLSDAVGDYRRPPVGRCTTWQDDDDNEQLCGGPIYPNDYDLGVHCARCGDITPPERLRLLGAALTQDTA